MVLHTVDETTRIEKESSRALSLIGGPENAALFVLAAEAFFGKPQV